MKKPFKMKYTNGKKADSSSFPFKAAPTKQMGMTSALIGGNDEARKPVPEEVKKAVDKKLEEKVGEVVNQSTSEGLV